MPKATQRGRKGLRFESGRIRCQGGASGPSTPLRGCGAPCYCYLASPRLSQRPGPLVAVPPPAISLLICIGLYSRPPGPCPRGRGPGLRAQGSETTADCGQKGRKGPPQGTHRVLWSFDLPPWPLEPQQPPGSSTFSQGMEAAVLAPPQAKPCGPQGSAPASGERAAMARDCSGLVSTLPTTCLAPGSWSVHARVQLPARLCPGGRV